MMDSRILIVSDGQKEIPYGEFMTLYDYSLVDSVPPDPSPYRTALLDLSSPERVLESARLLRSAKPEISLLFILDNTTEEPEEFLKKPGGYGISQLYVWKENNPVPLLERIQSLCHPEYPEKVREIAIILPVYNEESRIRNVIDFSLILQNLIETSLMNCRIVFVNDGSSDNTSGLVDKIIAAGKDKTDYVSNTAFFSTHTLVINTRKAGTYMEGLKAVQADIYLFADADNSFVVDDISRMINLIRDGYYDMVVGTKDMTAEHRPPIRRLMSFAKRRLTGSLLPPGVYDSQTGLKAMNAVAARCLFRHLHLKTGLAIDLEMLHLAKKYRLRVLQLPVVCIDRDGSHVDIIKDSIAFLKSIILIPWWNRKVRGPL
ncbi:MAG: glycosyltransferase [Spirochaetales bacterium]|nr:glycosyltransferase [Spirochaetales bacterium]